jgi:hypothetical protein
MSNFEKAGRVVGSLVVGLGMMYVSSMFAIKSKSKKGNDVSDPEWDELVDRMGEFRILGPEAYLEFSNAVSKVIEFEKAVAGHTNLGTPRLHRKYLHEVIECVREMRAVIEEKCSSALADFDEVAADIQRHHDDSSINMIYDCAK